MPKLDYKQELKEFYRAKVGIPSVVTVPKMNYIRVDGKGDPETSEEFVDAMQTLYPVAYTIKFLCKNKYGEDFSVMPLEGLWWTEDIADFSEKDKSNWLWSVMIMQPETVTKERFLEAIELVRKKKAPKALDKVKFEPYDEGRAAQVMYIGPYSEEGPTIMELHKFINDQGGILDEKTKHHHKIYFSDPRRTDPSKLKTLIRQPF